VLTYKHTLCVCVCIYIHYMYIYTHTHRPSLSHTHIHTHTHTHMHTHIIILRMIISSTRPWHLRHQQRTRGNILVQRTKHVPPPAPQQSPALRRQTPLDKNKIDERSRRSTCRRLRQNNCRPHADRGALKEKTFE
jgi:hypothetical protein